MYTHSTPLHHLTFPTVHHSRSHRLPSVSLLHHAMLQLLRGYHTLLQCVRYTEAAALWLNCKMKLGQRAGFALALYGVVARIR